MKKKKNKRGRPGPERTLFLAPDEKAIVDELISRLDHADPALIGTTINSPQLAVALIRCLPTDHPRTAEWARALGALFPDKVLQKEIRKIGFRLKQKGLEISVPGKEEAPVFQVKAERAFHAEAYVGPVDAYGDRAIFMLLERAGLGTEAGIGVVNDQDGLRDFHFGRYAKKKAKELMMVIFTKFPLMTPTSVAHLATLLEKAYRQNAGELKEPVRNYLQLRPWILDHVVLLDRPIVFENVPPEKIGAVPLTESLMEKFFEHPLIKPWVMDPDRLAPLIAEIIKVQESPLLLSEMQKEVRVQELKEKEFPLFFPESRKALLKNRLEEMAYIFLKNNEEEHAHTALSVAVSLAEDKPVSKNIFLRKLFERSLAMLSPDRRGSKKNIAENSSLIIKS